MVRHYPVPNVTLILLVNPWQNYRQISFIARVRMPEVPASYLD